jgi:hypothetical protein
VSVLSVAKGTPFATRPVPASILEIGSIPRTPMPSRPPFPFWEWRERPYAVTALAYAMSCSGLIRKVVAMLSPPDYLVVWSALTLALKRRAILVRCAMLTPLAICVLSCSKQATNLNNEDVKFGLAINRVVAARLDTTAKPKIQYGYLNREIDCVTGQVVFDVTKPNAKPSAWFIFLNNRIVVLGNKSARYNNYLSDCGRRAHDLDRKLGRSPSAAE